jgi:hypothetical protein
MDIDEGGMEAPIIISDASDHNPGSPESEEDGQELDQDDQVSCPNMFPI